MVERIIRWARTFYNKLVHSIAFIPAFMALGFLALSILALELDDRGLGQQVNRHIKWLTLKDAETARSIVSTVANGLIAVTVFSFSMVMIVLNQAASQLSNRLLENLIGNRFQKTVLGSYIGSIVYALFVLSNISGAEGDASVPSLSIYLLIALTIVDIFLFVYFLHYVTESIIYQQLIQGLHDRTRKSINKFAALGQGAAGDPPPEEGHVIGAHESGYFQRFNEERLLRLAADQDLVIRFLHPTGSYLIKGTPFLLIQSAAKPDPACLDKIFTNIDFYYGQEVDHNPYYGFQHLMEVGVKALSPGINDPGTAVLSLHALSDLLAHQLHHAIPPALSDPSSRVRLFTCPRSFGELFETSVLPIWDYGKKDRTVQRAVLAVLDQLRFADEKGRYHTLFNRLEKEVQTQQKNG